MIDEKQLAELKALLEDDTGMLETVPVRQARRAGRLLSTVDETDVAWLWPGYLPMGKVVLISGEPGIKKSWLMADWIAHVAEGLPWPTGQCAPIGGVILIAKEDDISDTILPRLRQSGVTEDGLSQISDLSFVEEQEARLDTSTKTAIKFPEHLPYLEQEIAAMSAALVVIDPIAACLSNTGDKATRDVMDKLQRIAAKHLCCIVLINHLNKGYYRAENIMSRLAGAKSLHAASRISYLAIRDTENEGISNLIQIKTAFKPVPPLSYKLVSDENGTCVCYIDKEYEQTQAEKIMLDRLGKLRKLILAYMFQVARPVSPFELASKLDVEGVRIRVELGRMLDKGEIIKLARGEYALPAKVQVLFASMLAKSNSDVTPSDVWVMPLAERTQAESNTSNASDDASSLTKKSNGLT